MLIYEGGHGVGTFHEIIAAMRAAVPPGQEELDAVSVRRLRDQTRTLMAAKADAEDEHARFVAVRQRSLCLPKESLNNWLRDATVVVTGGTGCIGSVLMAQIAERSPARLVSLSRGVTGGPPGIERAEYRNADVCDRAAVAAVIGEVKPDVVFHVAAQRSPALAETQVHRTVTTNVLGTRNVVEAAAEAGVPQVVCASTGKALRPYSPDVYTASKRAAEWLISRAATTGGTRYSAARFTHVTDNSIVYRRLQRWADGGVVRLHSPDIVFYAQSALESAQLLLIAGLGASPGEFRICAITRSRLSGRPAGPGARPALPDRVADAGVLQRLRARLRRDPLPGPVRSGHGRRREPAAERVRGGPGRPVHLPDDRQLRAGNGLRPRARQAPAGPGPDL